MWLDFISFKIFKNNDLCKKTKTKTKTKTKNVNLSTIK